MVNESSDYNPGNTSADQLAAADAAARRRKSEWHRPREGWRLCSIIDRSQIWLRQVGNRTEMVGGTPRARMWSLTVMDGDQVINRGVGWSLAAAMLGAEEAKDQRVAFIEAEGEA